MMRPTAYYGLTLIWIILLSSSSCFARKHSHHKKHHAIKPASPTPYNAQVLNVDVFGAKADGKSDNSQAFKKAWDKACNSSETTRILVPKGKIYYVKHINFTGPCHSAISLEIKRVM